MKKLVALALCILFAFSFAACSKSAENDAAGQIAPNESFDYYGDSVEEGIAEDFKSTADSSAAGATQNEKIIKTVELTVETKEYEEYISSLTASVAAVGGYIENSTTDYGRFSYSNRGASYVVRIPAEKLSDFLDAAGKKGTVISKTENQKNVTLEYVDLESRIEAYKTEKATLMGLLEKAESLENILAIQERLSEVNYQIETYTSQLKVLENRVGYSTVTLSINEVERVTETEPTLWTRIKDRFLDNLDGLVDWLKDMIVGIIGGLPVIIPLGLVTAAAILIIRKLIRKRKGL